MNRWMMVSLPALMLATPSLAAAETAVAPTQAANAVEEVVVTAQRRSETQQTTPLSLEVLSTKRLVQTKVASFDGFAKLLPSLSYQTFGPGQAQLTIRGVTNGGDGLSIGSEPTVGLYVDDIPVTTIANSMDPHIYDMERIEALSGPQGTLFGSASLSGTVRLITNKPDPKGFAAGVDIEGSSTTDGGALGDKLEGFINIPISPRAAIRLVAYEEHDGGFINNIAASASVFPTSGAVRDNAALARNNFNPNDVIGGRAALKIDLNDNWTLLPQVLVQQQRNTGVYFYKPGLGDLNIDRYFPDYFRDRWIQSAMTIQGKIGKFELTYNAAYLDRLVVNISDYSDYAFFYDNYYAASPSYFGDNFRNNAGDIINPSQYQNNSDYYSKLTQELRIASPKEDRLRFVAGIFYQRQTDRTRNEYIVPGLADSLSLTGLPGVNYMNAQYRVDRDYAAYLEGSYDILHNLTLTAGTRVFAYDNTVVGFFGFNALRTVGEAECFHASTDPAIPCINIDATAKQTSATYKVNLSWRVTPDLMLYATTSDGFRPGGINRIPGVPAYLPDYLTNYEIGWKTSWLKHRLRFNGALFHEIWSNAQFGVTGPVNGITEIVNAGGAHIDGIDTDIAATPVRGLTLSAAGTWLDAKTTRNTCLYFNPQFDCSIPLPDGSPNALEAPAGTRLPVSSHFKGNLTARWEVPFARGVGFLQATIVHLSSAAPSLNVNENQLYGLQPAYTATDFSMGFNKDKWGVSLFLENAFDTRGQERRTSTCQITICGTPSIAIVPIRPRTIRLSVSRRF
jgi:outer membrane receptor protein involved in Fe transport